MRIRELLLDKISESRLFEMAKSRRDAKDKITSLSPQLFDHLIKLFVFNSPENKQHWITEINTWLWQIDKVKLKPDNKKPNWQTQYNWIVFDSDPHYNRQYVDVTVDKMIKRSYHSVKLYDYDSENVLNNILSILLQVCKDIENDQFIKIEDYLPN